MVLVDTRDVGIIVRGINQISFRGNVIFVNVGRPKFGSGSLWLSFPDLVHSFRLCFLLMLFVGPVALQ